MHDAAFDQGYLTVDNTYHIQKAMMLQESIERDTQVGLFFKDVLSISLLLPPSAKMPAREYLDYHRYHRFRG